MRMPAIADPRRSARVEQTTDRQHGGAALRAHAARLESGQLQAKGTHGSHPGNVQRQRAALTARRY